MSLWNRPHPKEDSAFRDPKGSDSPKPFVRWLGDSLYTRALLVVECFRASRGGTNPEGQQILSSRHGRTRATCPRHWDQQSNGDLTSSCSQPPFGTGMRGASCLCFVLVELSIFSSLAGFKASRDLLSTMRRDVPLGVRRLPLPLLPWTSMVQN